MSNWIQTQSIKDAAAEHDTKVKAATTNKRTASKEYKSKSDSSKFGRGKSK